MNWTRGNVPGRHSGIRIGAERSAPPAPRLQYSTGIVLQNYEGVRISSSSTMPGDATREFYRRTVEALNAVRALHTGAEMLREIDASGRELLIIKGPDNLPEGSCVVAYPGDMKTSEQRFVKQLRPPSKPKLNRMVKEGAWVSPTQAYTSELTRLLDRAKQHGFSRAAVAGFLGIPPGWLGEMEQGARRIEDNEYYKLCMYLYDFLAPGKGTDAEMRLVFTQEQLPDEPFYMIMGHELVHAWRMMTGRRIFEGGWEEEAMTTGLPPFSGMKYSENRLRIEAGLPMRTGYSTPCQTGLLKCLRALHVQPAREDRPFGERDIVARKG